MQQVPKANKKHKKWVLPVVILLTMACLAGGILLLERIKADKLPPLEDTYTVRTLHSFDIDTLQSVTVSPPTGEPYTFLYQDDTLVLKDDVDYPVRPLILSALLQCAQNFEVQDTILDIADEATISLSDFGLAPAKASATFTYQDGTTLTQYIGTLMPLETPMYYAMFEGDTHIYAVSSDVYDAYRMDFSLLHTVESPAIQSDLIDRVTLNGEKTFSAFYQDGLWHMDAPYLYPLDDTKMQSFLDNLDSLRFSSFVGSAQDLNLADYGLDNPRITLTIDFAASVLTVPNEDGEEKTYDIPKSSLEIALGKDDTEVIFYALYNGNVLKASYFTFGFITNFSMEQYLLKNPVSFATNNLSYVSYRGTHGTAAYDVRLLENVLQNNDLETDEYGNIIYYVHPSRNGVEIDSTEFLRWYSLLSDLSVTTMLDSPYPLSGDPVATIVLRNGDKTIERTIDFYPYSPVYQLVAINGVALFTIRADWESTLQALP